MGAVREGGDDVKLVGKALRAEEQSNASDKQTNNPSGVHWHRPRRILDFGPHSRQGFRVKA